MDQSHRSIAYLLPALLLLLPAPGRAEVDVTWGGMIQSDIRFRVQEKRMGGFWNRLEAPRGVERNQNLIKLKTSVAVGSFAGVADVDFVWTGYLAPLDGVGELSLREKVDPYRLDAHALYLEAADLLVEGLDLRVGQQLVLWGKGDQFNPTNTINAGDLEDTLLFGDQLANLMVRLDYTRWDWTLSGVLVPLFKPAILPHTGVMALAAGDRLPFTSDPLRWRIHAEKMLTERHLTEGGVSGVRFPTVVAQAIPILPERSFDNMQFALRLAGTVGEQDLALSYYFGRTDIPQPFLNYTRMVRGAACDPLDPGDCIDGTLQTETYLGYPRVQVIGLNMAGQVNPLGWISKRIQPLGYRLELGVYFPQEASIALLQERLDFGIFTQPAGEYAYVKGYQPGDPRPRVVESTPFAKWTLGLDYSFGRHLYANVQWVHGLADEFGAGDFISEGWSVRRGGVTSTPAESVLCLLEGSGAKCAHEILRPRLADYLVLGLDIKFLEDKGLLRVFTIWDLSGYTEEQWDKLAGRRVRQHHSLFSAAGFSAVIFPELSYNFGNGLELALGALLELGKTYTKFGDPAAGGSLIWTRARYSY